MSERSAVIAAMSDALAARRGRMGDLESGLYNFYSWKLDNARLLSPYDLGVADFLRSARGRWRRIWDIGAGVGQLSAVLAADGHHVVAVERDPRRMNALEEVHAAAALALPDLSERIETRAIGFPDCVTDEQIGGDLALVLGFMFTAEQDFYDRCDAALARFAAVIVDISRVYNLEPDEAVWRRRAEVYSERYGLERQRKLFDWTDEGATCPGRVLLLERGFAEGREAVAPSGG